MIINDDQIFGIVCHSNGSHVAVSVRHSYQFHKGKVYSGQASNLMVPVSSFFARGNKTYVWIRFQHHGATRTSRKGLTFVLTTRAMALAPYVSE